MRKNTIFKMTALSMLLLIVVLGVGFLCWANDYYHVEDWVLSAVDNDESVVILDNLTVIAPSDQGDIGIIFYPGAKVEAISYVPLMEKLKEHGFTCVIVKMPLNMAIFDSNGADKAMKALPKINKWYVAGHSMGGAMASVYAQKNPDKIQGLILMGAYVYGDYPPDKSLTIYGSFNWNIEKHISYSNNIVKIEGGNHAQFGNYGKQKGDPDATISADEQQNATVAAIVDFVERK